MENKKIKVLHFSIANSGGGITKFALQLWNAIDKERFQFDFVTMSKKLDFATELESQGCKIHYLTVYSEQNAVKFEEEIIKILDYGYDILHLHTSWWRGFSVEEIAMKRGVPRIIVHSHNTDVHIPIGMTREEARELHHIWQRKVSEDIATDFWACSQKAADWLYGNNISAERLKIIPNAIELDKFYYREDIRIKYRKNMDLENRFVIGMIARFQYQKNHDFAIKFFNELNKINDNVVLLLVGIGELQEEIEKLVLEHHLETKVKFLGLRDDVENLVQAMDLFILPSLFEGLPITLVEAQASGLKCITSEAVTKEIEITSDIKRLPLDVDIWVKEALIWRGGYKRKDTSNIMRNKGFDIDVQIKQIEKLYSGE